MNIIDFASAKAGRFARLFRFQVWVLEGTEAGGEAPFCLAFAGCEANKNYVSRLAFSEAPRELALGLVWLWLVPGLIRRRFPQCSLLIYEVEEDRERAAPWIRRDFTSPVWMPVEMDVAGSVEASMRKTRYKTISKKVAASGLDFVVRTDPEAFDHFYDHMHLPYAYARHENATLTSPREDLRKRYTHGELVMIRQGGKLVGGSLIDFGRDKPRFLVMGVLNGAEEYLKMGVADAVYYFSFERVIQRGGGPVSLGNSHGFLKDGVLLYKFSLGGYFGGKHYAPEGCFHFRLLKKSAGLRGFLGRNPMLTMDSAGRYFATFFAETPESLDADASRILQDACKKNASPLIRAFADLEKGLRD